MSALELSRSAIDAFVGPSPDYSKAIIATKCKALMAGYHARWADAGYVTLSTETVYRSNLWNPETQRRSRSFEVAGKVDVDAMHSGRHVIIDHKTTSEDISDPNAPYWRQLMVERQPTHYMLLEWLNGRKVEGAIWDVVRKPGISPKKLARGEYEAVSITGHYSGRRTSPESVAQLQADPERRETLEMYEARLALDCTTERPQWYFQRRPVTRLDSDIHEHSTELWEHGQELLHAINTNRHARNSGACMLYGRPCKFLGICSGFDNPESDNWKKKSCVHAELPGIEGDGRGVITNSRISCFQTCRRKEFFEYELGIERIEEGDGEALYFGSCWHAAQQAWWDCFKSANSEMENANGNIDNGSPVIEIGTADTINQTV